MTADGHSPRLLLARNEMWVLMDLVHLQPDLCAVQNVGILITMHQAAAASR